MQQILLYADSLSWGIVPDTRRRLAFDQRWPGVMEGALRAAGRRVRVIEDCLNGRRTVWEDPFKPGRNGLAGLEQRIEVNSPLALERVAGELDCAFFDAGRVTASSRVDGVHLDADQHAVLGAAIAAAVPALLDG